VNPLADALAQWAVALTNGALSLDPVARARLARLTGRTIALEPHTSTEPLTLRFAEDHIELVRSTVVAPTVVLSGPPTAMLDAFLRGDFGGALVIDGDEVTLAEFADILRTSRPDLEAPLARVLGTDAARGLVGFVELGLETFRRVLRDAAVEGGELVKHGAEQRYLGRAEFDEFARRRHTASLRLDRLSVRVDRIDPARSQSS
jgi:ubiquinone biosynthesis protein UbiJ